MVTISSNYAAGWDIIDLTIFTQRSNNASLLVAFEYMVKDVVVSYTLAAQLLNDRPGCVSRRMGLRAKSQLLKWSRTAI